MHKRIGLVIAREKKGYTKKTVAEGTGINRQRYGRIESGEAENVDISEAYEIAKFLGYSHPEEIFLPKNVQKINK